MGEEVDVSYKAGKGKDRTDEGGMGLGRKTCPTLDIA